MNNRYDSLMKACKAAHSRANTDGRVRFVSWYVNRWRITLRDPRYITERYWCIGTTIWAEIKYGTWGKCDYPVNIEWMQL